MPMAYSWQGFFCAQGRQNIHVIFKENKDTYSKLDAELRKRLSIGAPKAEVPAVPVDGHAEAKEAVRARKS
jgi:recombination protein RecA